MTPTRRQFLQLPAAAALAGSVAAAEPRPNILWICADQQRWDTIHALGNPHIRTPTLDRLVAEGVAFTRAYVQSTVCTPSRASFLTGCYPSTLDVNRNGNAYFPERFAGRLISHILAEEGYQCGMVGKLHLAAAQGRVEPRVDDGYSFFRWNHHPPPEDFWPLEHNAYQRWLHEQGVDWEKTYRTEKLEGWPAAYQPGMPPEYHQTNWCAQETIRFVRENAGKPWLIHVNIFDPHGPFDPPREYLERMDVEAMPRPLFREAEMESQLAFSAIDHQTRKPRHPDSYPHQHMVAAYYAQIEQIDDRLAEILRALEETGQRENTIVIYTSDHGEMLGDHGLLQKGCRFYEGAVRIPLLIAWPGKFLAGAVVEEPVGLVDLVPTLLEAAALPVREQVQGESLLPFLAPDAEPAPRRGYVRTEFYDALQMPDGTHADMYFDCRYKLVAYHGHRVGELYDLEEDPDEYRNLWDAESARATKARLMEQLLDAIVLATDPGQPRTGRF